MVWSATYDSFGDARVDVAAITNNLRFSGQYYDAETGLHYNLNRYYDPATGRYLRIDPYGDGLNLYVYCFNNPVGLIDPEGLCAAKYIGVQFYYSLWHLADQFNRLVFFPLLDIASLLDRGLDWVTPTTAEERMAWAATFPAPMFADDIVIGGIAIAGRLPRVTRALAGYEKLATASKDTTTLVRKNLPLLPKKFAGEFEGPVRIRTFKAGEKVYRSPRSKELAEDPGRWFGTRRVATKDAADSMYQISKAENPIELLRTYEFTQDVTVYYGRVKGGTGYQIRLPTDVESGSVFKLIDEVTLR